MASYPTIICKTEIIKYLVVLPGESHGRRSLVGCSPCWGSDTTEWLHFHFSLSCIGEGNGNPLQCSCLENPRDGGAWWAAVYGVAQSRTRLKWLSSSSIKFNNLCYAEIQEEKHVFHCNQIYSLWKIKLFNTVFALSITFCQSLQCAFYWGALLRFISQSVQSLSCVRLFATPWIAAHQASLSITNSQSSHRLTSIESVMPSSHLILCRPLVLLSPIPPSIRVFANESTLRMRWPKYWSFSFTIIPYKEISFPKLYRKTYQHFLWVLVITFRKFFTILHAKRKSSILQLVLLTHHCFEKPQLFFMTKKTQTIQEKLEKTKKTY